MGQEIITLRERLHSLIEENDLDSEKVLALSRQLDELIFNYYCRNSLKLQD